MYILVFIPFFFEGGGGRGWRDIFSWRKSPGFEMENLATM